MGRPSARAALTPAHRGGSAFLRARGLVLLAATLAGSGLAAAGDEDVGRPVPAPALVERPDAWFRTEEGRQAVDNVRSWQNANGGWWKRYDTRRTRDPADGPGGESGPPGDDNRVWRTTSTFDNGATYSELRVLARAFRVLARETDRLAFGRGLEYLLAAQYANGGWPQRYPLQDNYGRHITFNDGAMTGVLLLLKDIVERQPDFRFVAPADRKRCREAFERGIDCILACQVRVRGQLTVWCQQHDAETFAPVGARTYELPSLCAGESAEIAMLLMSLDRPQDVRLARAIEAAAAWYRSTRLAGKRVERLPGDGPPDRWDQRVVDDPEAPPLWARFYDIETNEPFFCDRDGIKRRTMAEISRERRSRYRWYGPWGNVVAAEYARWKARQARPGPTTANGEGLR